LVTSRQTTWAKSSGVQALALGVLSRDESKALLHKHRPDLAEDDPHLDAIAEELGDLPLALHLAGSYLETYQDAPDFGNPADFLDELLDTGLLKHPALKGEDVTRAATNHPLHVGRTFALSYERLDPDDPADSLALALLARAACFAPGEPIPRELLLATLDLAEGDRTAARVTARGLNRLVGLGLLEKEAEGALRLHRLLAAFVRGVAADAEAQGAVEEILLTELSGRLDQAGYVGQLLTLQLHLRAVTVAAMEREDARAASLCNRLGYYLNQIGDLAMARPYLERALRIREQVLGAEHPDTATSLNNLGSLLQDLGDLAGAHPYYERALRINEQVLGGEHPDTALSLNNLGSLLQDQGDLAGARPY
jgi:tetratricopeptide (TPR) repeat protein